MRTGRGGGQTLSDRRNEAAYLLNYMRHISREDACNCSPWLTGVAYWVGQYREIAAHGRKV